MHESKSGTTIKILGDGRIPEFVTTTLESPPRIVVDIFCTTDLLGTASISAQSPSLKSVRVAYQPEKIRLVLDIKGVDIPGFTTQPVDNCLAVSLLSERKMDKEQDRCDKIHGRETGKKMAESNVHENTEAGDSKSDAVPSKKENPDIYNVVPVNPETLNNDIEIAENEVENVIKEREISEGERPNKAILGKKLTRTVTDDGRRDTELFQQCLGCYNAQDWSGTIEKLNHLIKTYPDGRYAERAYFLLAKSYEKLNSRSISDHFSEIKDHYENAVNRFPESDYVPEALLCIGNLYFKIENYYEALGYYNLVIKKDKHSISAVKALMKKVDVLLLKKKRKDALSVLNVLEDITSLLPDMPERMEARKLKAKILYAMNRFHDSLNILNKLKQADPENIIKFPEISLYLGYNYYQLGDNIRARKNLFRFYNICPGREANHLILTQIGDTYRNENLIEDAAKIYRMVLERCPKTDGAIISQIRLAEQQEKINWIEKTRKEIGSPTEIYENIVKDSIDNDEKNPLVKLSSLKLAITYQKDKKYKKSLNVLKELKKKYPGTSLKKEMRHALLVAMQCILKQEIKGEKHINVINFYLKEKELFLIVNAPELYLSVARAFNNMNLEKTATEIFKKADPLLLDSEKPPDLLFFVGKHLVKIKQFKSALKRFDILIDKYPSDKYVSDAYQLKGSILLKQKKYKLAADTFSVSLRYPVTKCKRAMLLIEKAKALTGSNSNEKALKTINEANGIKKDCEFPDYNTSQEIGDLYLNLGYAKKAATFFNQAMDTATEKSDKISLKFKIAQCYLLLNKKEDSFALYNQILSFNDPFWSNLAQE
ncbi:MAG: tetratricopeptide repeat protein, partial [Thermodesulfobacteriota bacterium]|nr:tetratricopeptide repeat protein [Thermodesulfobacteriota bacterium]